MKKNMKKESNSAKFAQNLVTSLTRVFFTLAIFVFMLGFVFGYTKTAQASVDEWDFGGFADDDWSYVDYYVPNFDYQLDYYAPNFDYYYQPATQNYSYPSYNYNPTPVSYSSPAYIPTYTPQYKPTVVTGSSYNNSYIPPVPAYVPTATANSNSNANASSQSNNTNTNTNSNNSNNVNNNVNTNNVNIIFGTPISGSTYNTIPNYQNLDGSCMISPNSVTTNQEVRFTANAYGGNGNYTYSWTGTDGVSAYGQSFTGRYQYPGSKTATVTISSGGQTITRSCSVSVIDNYINYNYNPVSVYCTANPSSASIGQNIIWNAYATGGNGNYTYSWTGTDGLAYSNASAIQKVYTTGGLKTATVTVWSNNGQSISASCSTNINGGVVSNATVIREPSSGTPISGVFLSEVPATGIDVNLKTSLFILGLALWSSILGYIIVKRNKKAKIAFQSHGSDIHARIQAFKLANMQKKGLIK